jgi:hypothetical protein
MCEDCNDTGEIQVDEYEHGQLVGVATVTVKCYCQRKQEEVE